MRYLAQFSEAPKTGVRSFWEDAQATEDWLVHEGRQVSHRELTLRARTMRALRPWLHAQSKPLVIDAWLDPMEITVTWSYLIHFLAELSPDRIWIPCGNDSWVGWTPRQVVIRAASQSWLWAIVEDVWDPAGWLDRSELEWWADGRLQHVVRLPWGISEQRVWSTGWEEWTLNADSEQLRPLWLGMAERLGARALRVRWCQETFSTEESLLGIPARYLTCELAAVGRGPDWLKWLALAPEPTHVRAQAVWSMPQWNRDWAIVMTLRRVQRGTRLETTYTPRGSIGPEMWKSLQRERRQIPILQLRPLLNHANTDGLWDRLQSEARRHQRQERLTQHLKCANWPTALASDDGRIRLRPGWTIRRWASQPGLWVIGNDADIEVSIEWPTEAHPGNIGVAVTSTEAIAMNEWVRDSHFKRLSRDRHYWANWINQILLPVLETFDN
jgi:hypothetical protein